MAALKVESGVGMGELRILCYTSTRTDFFGRIIRVLRDALSRGSLGGLCNRERRAANSQHRTGAAQRIERLRGFRFAFHHHIAAAH